MRLKYGEIDILAREGETVVVVEVKSIRRLGAFDPIMKIDYRKQKKLRVLAKTIENMYPDLNVRVDAVTVYWKEGNVDGEPILTHYRNIIQTF